MRVVTSKRGEIYMSLLLQTRKLCKTYANEGIQNHVLSNIDMNVDEGEFIVIMGASGSGKSTLLYCLSGMTKATSGEIIYKGQDIAKYDEKQLNKLRTGDFGFVFQQMNLISNLTLFENVAVPGYLNKANTKADVDQTAKELLSLVGIDTIGKHLPAQSSGGQQQRCAIARSLINYPNIVFADEPTGALSRSMAKEILDLFTKINEKGQTVLMVTHDLRTALRASRILYLEDGKVKGELRLSPFNPSEEKQREAQVNAWLTSLNW